MNAEFNYLKQISIIRNATVTSFICFFVFSSIFSQSYQVDWISMDIQKETWCVNEENEREITVTLRNSGSETWNTNGQTTNLGVRWSNDGGGINTWSDYHLRTNTGQIAPGQTETFTFTIEAKFANGGPAYTTNLTDGSYNLVFDIVNEGQCWFANNNGICGPGNSFYVSPDIEIYNNCLYFCEDGVQDLTSPVTKDNVLWYANNDACTEPIHEGQIYSTYLDQSTLLYTNGFNNADMTTGSINPAAPNNFYGTHGQMFNIKADDNKDIIIHTINLKRRNTSPDVRIFYRPEPWQNSTSGSSAGWIEVLNVTTTGSVSTYALDQAFEVPAGCTYSMYTLCDVDYRNSSADISNGDLTVYSGIGVQTSFNQFDHGNGPRVFCGTLYYESRPVSPRIPYYAHKIAEPIAPASIANGGQYCEGENVSLSVQGGQLSDGAEWEWFSGGCGGAPINIGETYNTTADQAKTLYVRASSSGLCSASTCTDVEILAPTPLPLASGGTSVNECIDNNHLVSGVTAINGNISWVHNGNGSMLNDNTAAPTYIPDNNDLGNTIDLTVTVSDNDCGSDNETYSITFEPLPSSTIDPGFGNVTICENESHTVSGVSSNNGSILWTHDGNGGLTNSTTLTPTYTAHSNDAGETVTLTMTVTSNNSCGSSTSIETYIINIDELPSASLTPGSESTIICENDSYTVNGVSIGNGTYSWAHNGDGTLDNDGTLTPTYNAVSTDAGNTVTLTLTVESNNSCGAAEETITININVETLPTIDIPVGNDEATICENSSHTLTGIAINDATFVSWAHDGNGTLDDDGTLTPTYNAAATDAGNTVTLTLTVQSNNSCGALQETLTVEIEVEPLPTINIPVGNDEATICENDSHTVTGIAINDAAFVSWAHDGNGTLDNDGTLTPTYNAVAADAGNTVTLTLTVQSNNSCGALQETLTVEIEVEALPTIDIPVGNDEATICENSSHTVTGIAINDATFVSWAHDGNGTLDDDGTLTPTYNGVSTDAGNTVTLTLTIQSNNSCGALQETLTVEIEVEALPTIDIPAGNDEATICENSSHTVTGIVINDATFVSWAHDGNGTLDDDGTLTPTYNAVATDAGNTVTLTLTVQSNNSCGALQETLTVEIEVEPLPTIDLPTGEDEVAICEDDNHTVSNVVLNNATFVSWSHDGNGTLDDDLTLTPTYNAVPADAGNTVTLTLTVESNNSCGIATETLSVEIEVAPVAIAEVDASGTGSGTICEEDTYTITTLTLENGTIQWTHDGAGNLSNATTPTPTYTPVTADAGQTITLTATVIGSDDCNTGQSTASETFTLEVVGKPTINTLANQEHCDSYTLPTITGTHLVNAAYYTEEDGGGTRYESGETLTYTDFASYPVTLYLYDDSGVNLCEDETSFTLTLHQTPSYTLVANDPSTCDGNDGYIMIEGLIENESYSVVYTDGVTTNGPTTFIANALNQVKLENLIAGGYEVTVTLDGTSCSGSTEFTSMNNPDAPIIDNISSLSACDNYTLPPITGSELTGNEAYYDAPGGPNGTGQVIPVGTVITATRTIYAYDANGICTDQKAFTVTINETPILDPIADIADCDAIRLNDIEGGQLTSSASYFTQPNGGGTEYTPGTTIYFEDLTSNPMTLYAYDETGTNPNCFDEVSFEITIHQTPELEPLSDQEACDAYILPIIEGEELVDPAYYLGNLGQGQRFEAGDTINYEDYSVYPLTIYIYDETGTATNCSLQESFKLTLHPTPVIDAIADQEHCDVFTFPAITGNNLVDAYYYTEENGQGISYEAGDIVNYEDFTMYPVTLYVYDETGTATNCSHEVSFNLTLHQTPVISALDDQEVCANYELPTIEGDHLVNAAYYTATNGNGDKFEAGDIINVEDFSNYPVTLYIYDETGTSPNCSVETSFTLIIHELPTASIATNGGEYCDYETPNDITVNVTGTPSWEITYTLNGETNSITETTSPINFGNNPGEYVLIEVSDANCTNEINATNAATITIKESPAPPTVVSEDDYCLNNDFEPMVASGDGTITWYLEDDYSNTVHVGETYTPINKQGETSYFVSATENGCESELTTVSVDVIPCEIIIPEAITPNGDGYNDVLFIENLEVYPNTKLTIYNRWGGEIFQSNDYQNDWDGRSTNNLSFGDDTVPEGTYYYLLELGGEKGSPLYKTIYKGWVYVKP